MLRNREHVVSVWLAVTLVARISTDAADRVWNPSNLVSKTIRYEAWIADCSLSFLLPLYLLSSHHWGNYLLLVCHESLWVGSGHSDAPILLPCADETSCFLPPSLTHIPSIAVPHFFDAETSGRNPDLLLVKRNLGSSQHNIIICSIILSFASGFDGGSGAGIFCNRSFIKRLHPWRRATLEPCPGRPATRWLWAVQGRRVTSQSSCPRLSEIFLGRWAVPRFRRRKDLWEWDPLEAWQLFCIEKIGRVAKNREFCPVWTIVNCQAGLVSIFFTGLQRVRAQMISIWLDWIPLLSCPASWVASCRPLWWTEHSKFGNKLESIRILIGHPSVPHPMCRSQGNGAPQRCETCRGAASSGSDASSQLVSLS